MLSLWGFLLVQLLKVILLPIQVQSESQFASYVPFEINGIPLHNQFKPMPKPSDIQNVKLMNNVIYVSLSKVLEPDDSLLYSTQPFGSLSEDGKLDLVTGWKDLPSESIVCNHEADDEVLYSCYNMRVNLTNLYQNENEFFIAFHKKDVETGLRISLVLKVFRFIFMMESLTPMNVFNQKSSLVAGFRINNVQFNLDTATLSQETETIGLKYFNKAKLKFDFDFSNTAKPFQCEGILTKNNLNEGLDYKWKLYHLSLDHYVLFEIANNISSLNSNAHKDSFYVDLEEYITELKDQKMLFHLVCASGSTNNLNSYPIQFENIADQAESSSVDYALPFYKATKINQNQPFLIHRYRYEQTDQSPLPFKIETEVHYYPPLPSKESDSNIGLVKNYVEVGSSFVKKFFLLGKEIPIQDLDSNQVKPVEVDWDSRNSRKDIFQLELLGNSSFLTHAQALLWPEDGNLLQNFELAEFPTLINGTRIQNEMVIVNQAALSIQHIFPNLLMDEEITHRRIELRFFVSNHTHVTSFRSFIKYINSPSVEAVSPARISEVFKQIKIQGQSTNLLSLSNDECIDTTPLYITLVDSKIKFEFEMNPNKRVKFIELYLETLKLKRHPYGILDALSSDTRYVIYLSPEYINEVYVHDLKNKMIHFYFYIIYADESEVDHVCKRVRIYVPPSLHMVPLNTVQENKNSLLYELPHITETQDLPKKEIMNLMEPIFTHANLLLTSNPLNQPISNEVFPSSLFIEALQKFKFKFESMLRSAEKIQRILTSNPEYRARYLQTIFKLFLKPNLNNESTGLNESFYFSLTAICKLLHDYPNFSPLLLRAIKSPQLGFLYPTNMYKESEFIFASVFSNVFRICYYKEDAKETFAWKKGERKEMHILNWSTERWDAERITKTV